MVKGTRSSSGHLFFPVLIVNFILAFLAEVLCAGVPGPSEFAMASQGPIRRFEVIVTDMTSPSAETPAGTTMRANMEELRKLNCIGQQLPRQNVSALDIPEELTNEGKVFLAGSPANKGPYRQRLPGQHGDTILFNVLEHSAAHSCRYDIFTECVHV